MKRAFILLLLTFISLSARSQLIIALLFGDKLNTGKMEFGLVGGPVLSNLTTINETDSTVELSNARNGRNQVGLEKFVNGKTKRNHER